MANSGVYEVSNDDDFTAKKALIKDKLIVIDFHALWCGPCKAIAPKFSQLSLQYPQVAFLKVDVDKCKETAKAYQVSAMPTFKFVHGNEVKATITGADPTKLENKIKELSQTVASLQNAKSDPSIATGMYDLDQFMMDKNCLNEDEDHPLSYALQDNQDLYLESDCDAELLVSISFNQVVKLHSLKCQAPPNGQAPKTMKLYINLPSAMDFDSAKNGKALQEIVFTPENLTGESVVNLKFVKLQAVNNLTLFFADNQGDEETTIINRLTFYGKTVSTTNMGEFKRVAGKKGEAH